MATTDDGGQDYLRLRGWEPSEQEPGRWVDPHGSGSYTQKEAEAIQRQRDERGAVMSDW